MVAGRFAQSSSLDDSICIPQTQYACLFYGCKAGMLSVGKVSEPAVIMSMFFQMRTRLH